MLAWRKLAVSLTSLSFQCFIVPLIILYLSFCILPHDTGIKRYTIFSNATKILKRLVSELQIMKTNSRQSS